MKYLWTSSLMKDERSDLTERNDYLHIMRFIICRVLDRM